MHATNISTARMERAHLSIGIYALTVGYERTGKGFTARKRSDGLITWISFDTRELAAS
jgi:hypothetical protein